MPNAVLGPRQQKKRQKIIDSARRVFLQQGYANTSMNGLIRLVGGSKATLYAHFSSKEQLFETVVECLMEEARPELALEFSTALNLAENLRLAVEAYQQQLSACQTVELMRLLLEAIRVTPALAEQLKQCMVAHFSAQLAEQLNQSGMATTKDCSAICDELLGNLFSLLMMQGLLQPEIPPQLADKQLESLINQAVQQIVS